MLHGIKLSSEDILWMNYEAQKLGYLLNVYHEEKVPEIFNEKGKPLCYYQNDDGHIVTMGCTDMTEGEMKALLQQRKVVQARIYHRDDIWLCFYYTYKGLAGEESGEYGSQSHYHFLTSKSNMKLEDLIKHVKDCDMPSSGVHILIDRK